MPTVTGQISWKIVAAFCHMQRAGAQECTEGAALVWGSHEMCSAEPEQTDPTARLQEKRYMWWGWKEGLWPAGAELPAGAPATGLLIGDAVGVGRARNTGGW